MGISAVIVDDERQGRKTLSMLLAKHCPDVDVVGEADSVQTAVALIEQVGPDLVFLDIEMPAGSGFELLEAFHHIDFDVIFVTAYDNYALRAIKVSALDYLLKPVNAAELREAVAKARPSREHHDERRRRLHLFREQVAGDLPDKIALPTEDGYVFVEIEDIVRCEASSNYTIFILRKGEKVMVSGSLGAFEELLADNGFFRVHHSHMINMRYVQKYRRGKRSVVVLVDGSEVEVSVRRREAFLAQFARR